MAQFTKGQSGNPGGRPKLPEELKLRMIELTPKAVDAIESILTSESSRASEKLKAAELLLDRLYGRPTMSLLDSELLEQQEFVFPIVFKD